jgi:hypothetical protein
MNDQKIWKPRKGDETEIPHSELAMHTKLAGKTIDSYQLVEDGAYAYVSADGKTTHGTPGEVLPFGLQHRHRIGAYAGHRPDPTCALCAKEPRHRPD